MLIPLTLSFLVIISGTQEGNELCNQSGQLVTFEGQKKIGYKNLAGEIVLNPRWVFATDFNNCGYAYADGFYINTAGKPLLQALILDNGPDYISEGLLRYIDNGKTGFIRPDLTIEIIAKYSWASPFRNGMSLVCQDCRETSEDNLEHRYFTGGKWGVIGKQGETLMPIENSRQDASHFFEKRR